MIEIEINDEAVTDDLLDAANALGDLTPLMQRIAEYLVYGNQDRIARGEAPDGTPYAPRSQTTIDRYNKLGISYGPPLNVTGDLRLSLAPASGPDYAMVGTNAFQAAVMHSGAAQGVFGRTERSTPIPWGDIPARPVLGISDDDVTAIRAALAEWLESLTD